MTDPIDLSLDLLRRLPPSKIEQNVDHIVNLIPSYAEELCSSVDQPLKVQVDTSNEGLGREFLCCDYNRDGDSWRSWISNTYHPSNQTGPNESLDVATGAKPSSALRQLELKANDAFETYAKLYFDSALSSVYLWDLESEPSSLSSALLGGVQAPSTFAGVVLFKKTIGQQTGNGTYGVWDSLHVFEVTERSGAGSKSSSGGGANGSASYKLTSTVMLALAQRDEGKDDQAATKASEHVGDVEIAGSLTRQCEADYSLNDFVSHIANVGKMIEEMEGKIRNQLQEVYFGKTKDIVSQMRSSQSLERDRQTKNLQRELQAMWKKKPIRDDEVVYSG